MYGIIPAVLSILPVHLAEPPLFLPGQSRDLRLIPVKSVKRFFRRAFTRNVMEEGDQIPDLCHWLMPSQITAGAHAFGKIQPQFSMWRSANAQSLLIGHVRKHCLSQLAVIEADRELGQI